MRKLLPFLSLLLWVIPAHATTYTAASYNPTDIQTAINNEQASPADGSYCSLF